MKTSLNHSPLVILLIAVGCLFANTSAPLCADEVAAPQAGQKIAFVGDSSAAFGWENSTGFIKMVSQALTMEGRQVEIVPGGVKGDTSKNIAARFKADALDKKPDWIVLSCGLNDVWYGANGVPLDQFKQNITSLVNQATAAKIKLLVLTTTLIGEDPNNASNQSLQTYNDVLRSIAQQQKLPLADPYADMQDYLTKARAANPASTGNLLTTDGVHLNGVGSEIVALGILKAFGCSDADIAQAKAAWDELPNAMVLSPVKLNIREYEALAALATQRGCSVDKLLSDTFGSSLTDLLNTNSAPAAPAAPAPPQFPKVGQ